MVLHKLTAVPKIPPAVRYIPSYDLELELGLHYVMSAQKITLRNANINDMSTMERYWICSCYFSHNIFLQQQRLHVTFYNESQFVEDYKTVSSSMQDQLGGGGGIWSPPPPPLPSPLTLLINLLLNCYLSDLLLTGIARERLQYRKKTSASFS